MAGHEESVLAFGFYGTRAVLFDISEQRVVFSINCGGFKRPFDFSWNSDSKFAFAFLKDGATFEYSPELATSQHFKQSIIHPAFHWRKVNSIEIASAGVVSEDASEHENTSLEATFITTSEDTAVFIGTISAKASATPRIETRQKILSHDSATRSSFCLNLKSQQRLVVIGGGRLQLRLFWESSSQYSFTQVASADPPPRRTGLKKAAPSHLDYDECRIMSVAAAQLEGGAVLVLAGRSDAKADLWLWNGAESDRLRFVVALEHTHAILSVSMLCAACGRSDDFLLLATACTDGSLFFWNVKDLVAALLEGLAAPSAMAAPAFSTLHASSPRVEPVHVYKPHVAGINSLDIRFDSRSSVIEVISSGDDQALCLTILRLSSSDSDVKKFRLSEVSRTTRSNIANSCVTGAKFWKNKIVTVSGDQRLCVWTSNDLRLLASTMLHVSDVSSVDVSSEREPLLFAAVVGQGLECVEITL